MNFHDLKKSLKMLPKYIQWIINDLETSQTLFLIHISLTDKFGAHQRRHQIPLKSYSYNGFGPESKPKKI